MWRRIAVLIVFAVAGCRGVVGLKPSPSERAAAKIYASKPPGSGLLDWRPLLGCYAVEDWHFALDSLSGPRGVYVPTGGQLVRKARSTLPPDPLAATAWFATGPQSFMFFRSNPLYGFMIEFVARGDSLGGRVISLSDIVGKPEPPTMRLAVREDCTTSGLSRVPDQ